MSMRGRNRWAYAYLAPFFGVMLLFSIFPIAYSFWLSFNDMEPLTGDLSWIGLGNYSRMLQSRFFYESIWNTVLIWIMSIVPQLTIAFSIALLLNNKWVKFRLALRNIYYFPNLVVAVTVGLMFGSLFSYPGGSVNQIITLLGWDPVHFANDPMLGRLVIAIAICWRNFGYNIIFFTAGINSISEDIIQAAEVDGCTAWQKVTRIIIPAMRPIIIFVLITSIIGGLQIFEESHLVFPKVTGDAHITMVKFLYEAAFVRMQFGYAAAVSYGIFVIIAFFSIIAYLVTKEKESEAR